MVIPRNFSDRVSSFSEQVKVTDFIPRFQILWSKIFEGYNGKNLLIWKLGISLVLKRLFISLFIIMIEQAANRWVQGWRWLKFVDFHGKGGVLSKCNLSIT